MLIVWELMTRMAPYLTLIRRLYDELLRQVLVCASPYRYLSTELRVTNTFQRLKEFANTGIVGDNNIDFMVWFYFKTSILCSCVC